MACLKRIISRGLALLVAAVALPATAACIEGHPSVAAELTDSSIVVVGTATEEHLVPDPDDPIGYAFTIYVVQVNEVLKGPAPRSLWLFSENTSARYPMDLGTPHLLFVEKLDDTPFVSNCGNSGPMRQKKSVYRAVKRLVPKSTQGHAHEVRAPRATGTGLEDASREGQTP